jgi:hypothetical protein
MIRCEARCRRHGQGCIVKHRPGHWDHQHPLTEVYDPPFARIVGWCEDYAEGPSAPCVRCGRAIVGGYETQAGAACRPCFDAIQGVLLR